MEKNEILDEECIFTEIQKLKNEIFEHKYKIMLKITEILREKYLLNLLFLLIDFNFNPRLKNNCNSLKTVEWNKDLKINIPTKFSAQIIYNIRQMFRFIN